MMTGIHERVRSGSEFHHSPTPRRPLASVARRRYSRAEARARARRPAAATLRPLRRALAQQALRAEDQDHDQDREHERLGPLAPRGVPERALVEGLDLPDDERPQNGAGQVADPAEDGGGERDQAEREPGVVADVELDEV